MCRTVDVQYNCIYFWDKYKANYLFYMNMYIRKCTKKCAK